MIPVQSLFKNMIDSCKDKDRSSVMPIPFLNFNHLQNITNYLLRGEASLSMRDILFHNLPPTPKKLLNLLKG